MGITRRKL